METLQINKANALKAFNEADKSGKKLLSTLFGEETFMPKNITDRVKSFDDACRVLDIDPESVFPTGGLNEDKKSLVAYAKLSVIIRALNEGWKPDWTNGNEYKYVPWFKEVAGFGLSYFGCGHWYSGAAVGSRLCYRTRELAEYGGKKFLKLYKDYYLFG